MKNVLSYIGRLPPLPIGVVFGDAQLWDVRAKYSVESFDCEHPVVSVAFGDGGDQIMTGGVANAIKVREYVCTLVCMYVRVCLCDIGHHRGPTPA